LRARKAHNRCARGIAALLILISAAWATNNVGFASLKIGIGSRECGMGDAGAAGADGPQSMYWNPALTGWQDHFSASVSYADWFLDMSKSALFVVRPTPIVNVGLGATVFNAGTMEFRDDIPTDEPLGTFTPYDYSLYLNVSRALPGRVTLGASGRFYDQDILSYNAHGWGADLGLAYEPLKNLKLAAAVMDVGSALNFMFADYALPSRAAVGASYALPLGWARVSVAADGGYGFFDRQFALNTGAEVVLGKAVALRGGYRILDQTAGMTLGIGFLVKGIRIDYAYGADGLSLGATHRFSVGYGY
jgi:hypothetical protein